MLVHDPIADMLTRLRNAIMRGHREIRVPSSKMKQRIAEILAEEGYIESFAIEKNSGLKKKNNIVDRDTTDKSKNTSVKFSVQNDIVMKLKYFGNKPSIRGAERVSKPGVRIYVGYKDVPRVKIGLGICVISTSKGVVTGDVARKEKVGGEMLFNIW